MIRWLLFCFGFVDPIPDRIEPDDEIVIHGCDVHLERMDDGHIWIAMYKGDKRVAVDLFSDIKIEMKVEEE